MGDKALENLVRAASQGGLTRRAFLARAAAIGLSATVAGQILAACGSSDDSGDGGGGTGEAVSIGFCSYGGTYQEAQIKAWVDPFMAANKNITVVGDEPTDYPKIKAMVEANNVTWDVVDIGNDFGIGEFEQYCEKLDAGLIPFDKLQPDLYQTTGYRVPVISYSVVIGYRSDKLNGKVPASFADFFDLDNFPGKRGVYNYASGGLPEIALVADGVAVEALYPLDMDRAFKKMDTIKDQLVWWDTGAQSAQLLADGEVSMGMSWNGRLSEANKEGADIGIMWDQHILTADYLMITKGSKYVAEANQLIAWMVSADNNAEISKYINYGPTNVDAVSKVPADVAKELPSTYLDTAIGFDDVWWGANYSKVNPDWQSWVQG
jgi:putative spermidine/putrescine transport system substrate-binding protein